MKAYRVFLGLGSNLGARERYLQAAVDGLRSVTDLRVVWASSVYETEPLGKTDQPRFLNACAEVETALSPPALLAAVKRLEQTIGRKGGGRWAPREIDIDILVYDGLVHHDESLTVPHPEMERRRFVLIPLRELAPDLVHPVSGMTVEELAAACPEQGRMVKTIHHLRV